MYCKIFLTYENDIKSIMECLGNKPMRVITTNADVTKYLKERGWKSSTFSEIFSDIGQNFVEVNRNSHDVLTRYRNSLSGITFNGIEIFCTVENFLFEEIMNVEKAKKILQEKEDIIFIFNRFSFSLFSILEYASSMGYQIDNGLEISLIKGKKITAISPNNNTSFLDFKNKTSFIRTIGQRSNKIPSSDISIGDKIRLFCEQRSLDINMLKIFGKHFIWKILNRFGSKDAILLKIEKRVPDFDRIRIGMFLTTDLDDFLKPHYKIMEDLTKKDIPYSIFIVDLLTRIVLTKKKIPFVDMFNEVYLLKQKIRADKEFQNVIECIRQSARENELTLIHRNRLSDSFKDEILHGISIMVIVDHLIRKMQLESLIVAIDGSKYSNIICAIAKKYHIQTISIETGIVNRNLERRDYYKADKICIYGTHGYEELINLGYDDERIVTTGSPKYDHIKDYTPTKSKGEISKHYNIDRKKPLVVIAMGRWHQGDEVWMSDIIKFCNKNHYEIIIKPHPLYKLQNSEESQTRINAIRENCDGMRFVLTYEVDSALLLSAADIVITDYSNMGIEAILFEKPMITVNLTGEILDNAQRFHEFGAALHATNYNMIERHIADIFNKSEITDELRNGRLGIIPRYNYKNDGNASQRIIDLLVRV